jgi:hypothetical protein
MTHKIIAVLVLFLSACGDRSIPHQDGAVAASDGAVTPPATDSAHTSRFAIRVFGKRVDTTYDYAGLEKKTQHLATADARVTLTEEDIEVYRVEEAPSSRIQLTLTAAATKRWQGTLAAVTDLHPFHVALDGKRLYVGVVYTMYGAAALDTPVLHVKDESGRVELRIGSHQGAWMGWGKGDASRIDAPEVRDLFRDRGALAAL